ncbi:tRNA pseudouridine(38-40) synthase TruA [Yaniella flava]|uniref:tRNA pseudouridine synthase A n=2 Tax=Yaniella flava TaxID=287930 RepID=A0ABN2U4U6_9MICC|nr:tRNA pseudouridine(38-40) synthase TruA [Micrococcaceae bacterium]
MTKVLSMTQDSTYRIRVDLAYDGTSYRGWAKQPGLPSVQAAVETGLETIFRGPIRTTVAGRTDAGVHAAHQVIHFDLTTDQWHKLPGHTPQRAPEEAMVSKLNGVLAREAGAIRILTARIAPEGFDARFSPVSRSYRYRITHGTPDPLTRHYTYTHRRALDVEAMITETNGVEGLHDFGSFCKPRPGATTIRQLETFAVEVAQDAIIVRLTADAFCHHMVRALVGALLMVGDGSRAPGWLQDRLAHPVRDSHMALAPAHGLLLETVHYPADTEVGQRADETRARRTTTSSSCD